MTGHRGGKSPSAAPGVRLVNLVPGRVVGKLDGSAAQEPAKTVD